METWMDRQQNTVCAGHNKSNGQEEGVHSVEIYLSCVEAQDKTGRKLKTI